MINSRKRSRAESDKGEETYIDLPQQFITRTGITYYKVGNIVSLTRGSIPNLMEDTPAMERIRNYCADLEFPSVDAGYILNAFGYGMISEQELIQRLKLWYECMLKPEQSFQAAYSEGAPIYGFLCTWKDILCDVNRKRKRKPRVHKFLTVYQEQLTNRVRFERKHYPIFELMWNAWQ
jgi:hypothetical protein